jgi:hypothetical protein
LTAATVRYVAAAKEGWGKLAKRRGRASLALLHAHHGVAAEISGPYLESLGWRYASSIKPVSFNPLRND